MKYIIVFLFTVIKFIAGPTMGVVLKFNYLTTLMISIIGGTTSVFIAIYLKNVVLTIRAFLFRIFNYQPKRITPFKRKFVSIWNKFGLYIFVFLTPLIFSPLLGSMFLVSIGVKKRQLIPLMIASIILWGLFLTTLVYTLTDFLIENKWMTIPDLEWLK